jgi:uncharacterized protein
VINPIKTEAEITELILADAWMMQVLAAAEKLNLQDWWIGAGFFRNKVWNHMEGKDAEQTRDVDLVYFNDTDAAQETDWVYDEKMNREYPFAQWEIRNQARMHYKNGFDPFVSTEDGISHWTETATAVAVRLNNGLLEYLFCYGVDDLFNLVARPTPYSSSGKMLALFRERIIKKQWQQKWPDLQVTEEV